jgi:hypothetical protein
LSRAIPARPAKVRIGEIDCLRLASVNGCLDQFDVKAREVG